MSVSVKLLKKYLTTLANNSKRQIIASGWVLFLNYPLYYLIWLNTNHKHYENPGLRIVASTLCLPLILQSYWPKRWAHWLALYWHIAACYCLPFFFTFMTFKNQASTLWLMNSISALFFLMLLFDVMNFLVLASIGILSGWVTFMLTNHTSFTQNAGTLNLVSILATFAAAIVIGTLFSHNKQVIETIKRRSIKAEANNQAKTEFITNMSHDLRTPLTGGMGLAEEIIKHGKTPSNRKRGKLLLDTFKRYLTLFNEVLEVLSLESENTTASIEPFSLRGLIDHNLALQAAALKAKGLSIELFCDDELAPIYEGYAHYLSRIVLNLISNAVKFTNEGSVTIDINAVEKNADKHTIEIKVHDTGIGIPHDKFEEIFYHFSRLHPSYEAQYEGYGLGLYSVQQYVKLMHGTVSVESTEGEGSTFSVTVPLKPIVDETIDKASVRYNNVKLFDKSILEAVEEDQEDNEEELENNESEGTKTSDAKYTVLIVEDNKLAATMAAMQFENAGCATDIAATGQKALKLVQSKHYDMVLMDIGLGSENGAAVTKQIQALGESYAQIPIVALTAHANDLDKQECLGAGMVEVLKKPVTTEQAIELLEKYVNLTT